MFKKLLKRYLFTNDNKIIFTDSKKSYTRKSFLKKVQYYKKILEFNGLCRKSNNGIAICLDRNADYFAIIFASWLIGAYYLPISKNSSEENINYQIKKSGIILFCYSENNQIIFKKIKNKKKKLYKNICYIIFTSGSTGEKKGVCISANNFNQYLIAIKKSINNNFKSKSLLITGDISFDIVNADIAFALIFDCEICISENQFNIFSLFILLEKRKIQSIYAVPTMWEKIILMAEQFKKKYEFVKNINCGGEILTKTLFEKILKIFPKAKIINFYGPTEFTINSTFCVLNKKISKNLIDKNNNISIGKPLKGVTIKIKNGNKKNYGELLLSGKQNMLGYINSNVNKKIIINNKNYYATGDIVSINKSKNIFFISRKKDYIKFKGMRINLQSISSKISKICKNQVIVLIKNKELCAFSKKKILTNNRKEILSKLDNIEIPKKFIHLKNFPMLSNNKIDKKKLENDNF